MRNLDESLGFLINRAAVAMRWAIEKRLARHGLTAPQWAVLARLWEKDGQAPSVLGASLHFDKATATGIVDRLERKKLVRKTRDPVDRRFIRVFLTPRGAGLKEKLVPLAGEVNSIASAGLSPKEQESLLRALLKIWRNLEG